MADAIYDICIIGGGAAACSAGLFCARRGMKTAIIAKEFGGQTASTAEIENYPGIGRIEGPQLMDFFVRQAETAGCDLITDEALRIIDTTIDGEKQRVETLRASYDAHALILAYGKRPRMLGVEREHEFYLSGSLCYGSAMKCKRCHGGIVGIVGGGNSALSAVAQLALIAQRILLIHRRSEFRGEKTLVDRLHGIVNCTKVLNAEVSSLYGNNYLEGIGVRIHEQDKENIYPLDVLVVAIGFEYNTDLARGTVECDSHGAVIIDQQCATSHEGIFAAGDCTALPYQQIVISAGDGAKAALSACNYVSKKKGVRLPIVDWGFVN